MAEPGNPGKVDDPDDDASHVINLCADQLICAADTCRV